MQFIGYHVSDYGEDHVPVATGADRESCLALTIRRTLAASVGTGEISVQQRDDVTPEIFAELTNRLNAFFEEKGISAAINRAAD